MQFVVEHFAAVRFHVLVGDGFSDVGPLLVAIPKNLDDALLIPLDVFEDGEGNMQDLRAKGIVAYMVYFFNRALGEGFTIIETYGTQLEDHIRELFCAHFPPPPSSLVLSV